MASRLYDFICDPIGSEVKMAVTSKQKSSQKVHLSVGKPQRAHRKSYDYIKAYSPAYDLIREQYWRPKPDYG